MCATRALVKGTFNVAYILFSCQKFKPDDGRHSSHLSMSPEVLAVVIKGQHPGPSFTNECVFTALVVSICQSTTLWLLFIQCSVLLALYRHHTSFCAVFGFGSVVITVDKKAIILATCHKELVAFY